MEENMYRNAHIELVYIVIICSTIIYIDQIAIYIYLFTKWGIVLGFVNRNTAFGKKFQFLEIYLQNGYYMGLRQWKHGICI